MSDNFHARILDAIRYGIKPWLASKIDRNPLLAGPVRTNLREGKHLEIWVPAALPYYRANTRSHVNVQVMSDQLYCCSCSDGLAFIDGGYQELSDPGSDPLDLVKQVIRLRINALCRAVLWGWPEAARIVRELLPLRPGCPDWARICREEIAKLGDYLKCKKGWQRGGGRYCWGETGHVVTSEKWLGDYGVLISGGPRQ